MEEKEKFEANKKSNAPFLRALSVLMKEKNLNQAQVAEYLNTKSGTFSDYKNGKKRASQDMYERLARAFEGRLNIHYLTGESEYMMLANVPDEEIVEYSLREGNPDYDILKKAKSSMQPTDIPSPLDRSFIIEKEIGNTKSYMDKFIESLEKQIKEKDDRLAEKDERLAEKDERLAEKSKYIEVLEKRVAELEAAAEFVRNNDFAEKWPFVRGVADERRKILDPKI